MLASIHNTVHWDLFFASFCKMHKELPVSSQIAAPDGNTFQKVMYCNVHALGIRTIRSIVTINIKKSTKVFHPEAVFSPGFI